MTKHELAAATWREMRDDLIDRGILHDSIAIPDREAIDAVMIALIENSYVAAVAAVQEENEDRLGQVDNALLKINKPVERRITVDSYAFPLGDGHAVLQPDEEMVIREKNGQVFITKRQG